MAGIKPISQLLSWESAVTPGQMKVFRVIAVHSDGTMSIIDLDLTRMTGIIKPFQLST